MKLCIALLYILIDNLCSLVPLQNEADGTSAEGEQEYASLENGSSDEFNMAPKAKSSVVASTSNVVPMEVSQVSHLEPKL